MAEQGGAIMLHRDINQFLEYCQLADFSVRSIQALTARLNEFEACRKAQRIRCVKKITYRHLVNFVADYKAPSIHVKKSRVWTLRQFYHFLTLHRHVPKNIALKLPYPKIEKTVPQFLTIDEYNRLIRHFSRKTQDVLALRNLIIIMLLGMLGLRTSTLIALNIEDIDVSCGLMWIREKGRRQRNMVLPHSLCKIIHKYLQLRRLKKGPLLISKRKKRISQRTLQDIFRTAEYVNENETRLTINLVSNCCVTICWFRPVNPGCLRQLRRFWFFAFKSLRVGLEGLEENLGPCLNNFSAPAVVHGFRG
jgi:integrase/recombinase XerC